MDVLIRVLTLTFFLFIASGCSDMEQSGKLSKSTTNECAEAEVKGQYIVNWKDGRQTLERAMTDKVFVSGFLKNNDDEILFSEPNYRIRPLNLEKKLSALAAPVQPNWGVYQSHAETAWPQNIKGRGVIVAVVDSGIDWEHPQLNNQFQTNEAEAIGVTGEDDDHNGFIDDLIGWNFLDNSALPTDEIGHGTHVAGVILAQHSTGQILGMAPEAKLLAVDFMDDQGGTTDGAIKGLKYAIKMGAKVINASWGGSSCSKSLQLTFKSLQRDDVLFIVASGNSGSNIDIFPEYPAAFHLTNQITVGALDPSGLMASFSNYGSLVHMMAPGVNILSTVPQDHSSNGYATMSGTSMSAPFVSGAAALLWGKAPNATATQIKKAILDSLEILPNQSAPRGTLRVDRALNLL